MNFTRQQIIFSSLKSVAIDLAFVAVASCVLLWSFDAPSVGVVALIPIGLFSKYVYADFKFRGAFVPKLIALPILKSILVVSFAGVLSVLIFAPRSLEGWAFALSFFLPPLILFGILRRSLSKTDIKNNRFDGNNISISYDQKTGIFSFNSKGAKYRGPLPGDYLFYFEETKVNVSTNTTVYSSSGQMFTAFGTGSRETRGETIVKVAYCPTRNINYSKPPKDQPWGLFQKGKPQSGLICETLGLPPRAADSLETVLRNIDKAIFPDFLSKVGLLAKKEQDERNKKKQEADEQVQSEARERNRLEALAKDEALKNVRAQCAQLLEDWQIDPSSTFKTYRFWEKDGGYICTMLAADKAGRGGAVLNDGKDSWSGSWKNAQVNEAGDTLEIQIDDPEYREKNLKERRFVIKHLDHEQRVEWIDRIRILSAQA